MNLLEYVKKMLEQAGAIPARVGLIVYQTQSDFFGGKIANHGEYQKHVTEVEEVAEYLAQLGSEVRGVEFNPTAYRSWLGKREDNPSHRSLWAAGCSDAGAHQFVWELGLGWVLKE